MAPLRIAAAAALISLTFACGGPAAAQTPSCEPDRLAQKFPSLAGKTVKIGNDPQSPPYIMRDPQDFNKIIGLDADLARAALSCHGIKYEFFHGGWSGLFPAVMSGQIDVMWNNLYYTPTRAKGADYVLYMQAGTGAIAHSGNPKNVTGIAGMCGLAVTVGLGSVEEATMRREDEKCKTDGKPGINVMTFPELAAGIRLMQSKRADILLWDLSFVDSYVKDNAQSFTRAFRVVSSFKIGAAVKKGNKELLQAIYEGIAVAQKSGKQKALFEQYGMDPSLVVEAEMKAD
jgi:polar amino acid transport system substrate-binding protein